MSTIHVLVAFATEARPASATSATIPFFITLSPHREGGSRLREGNPEPHTLHNTHRTKRLVPDPPRKYPTPGRMQETRAVWGRFFAERQEVLSRISPVRDPNGPVLAKNGQSRPASRSGLVKSDRGTRITERARSPEGRVP